MKQAIYRDFAHYYDPFYSNKKSYEKESDRLVEIIKQYKLIDDKSLLDVGCGTAKHLKYLKKSFKCTGVDINEDMLRIARKSLPKVEFVQGDMTSFNLNKQFGTVVTLFSAIGYVKTLPNLRKAISRMNDHLLPGGVMIIDPWHRRFSYKKGKPHLGTYESKNLKIARVSVSELLPNNISRMVMHYLVGEKDKEVIHFTDVHEMGLFSEKDTLNILKSLGLIAGFEKQGLHDNRGLYIARKPL